jgi:hypothetical protein
VKVGDLVRVKKENIMIAVDPMTPLRDCLDNKLAIISSLPSPTSKLSICSVIPLGQKEPVPVLMEYLYPVSIEEQLAKEIGDMTDEEVEENVKKYFQREEHPPECPWYKDWHSCNCGLFDKENKE